MKLADLNQNNIKLGYRSQYPELAVPTSWRQTDKAKVGDEEDIGVEDGEIENDIDDIGNELDDIERFIQSILVANSYAPYRSTPDNRTPPNTANIV